MIIPDALAKKGGNGGGNTGGGGVDPVFTADSADPLILSGDSHSLDAGGQIVFRNAEMSLAQFKGTDSNGECSHQNYQMGTLVLKPKSSKTPEIAVLNFWFQSSLESGDLVTHLFTMEGGFDEQDNWPPGLDPDNPDSSTTVTFDFWAVAAESRKAQRMDCAGESSVNLSWTVTVTQP
jgi:hypothetical protein